MADKGPCAPVVLIVVPLCRTDEKFFLFSLFICCHRLLSF